MNFWDNDAEMKAAFDIFVVESRELLQSMEDGLLGLEHESDPTETIGAIFRAAHTIKGSSGLFGLDVIVRFTHVVENVLDRLRDGVINASPELVSVLLPCRDHISSLVEAIAADEPADTPTLNQAGDALLSRLQPFLDPGKQTHVAVQEEAKAERSGGGMVEAGNWHLSLRFGVDSFRNGMDPLSFIRYLGTLGDVVSLTTMTQALPAAEDMDPESCYLGFEIDLKSAATKEAIEGVFEFVREDSLIHILPPHSLIDEYIEMIRNLPEDDSHIGEILVRSGVLTERELTEGLALQKTTQATDENPSAEQSPLGEILVDQNVVQQPLVDAALDKQKQNKESKARENQSIRVDAARLDKLIELVGELVIAGAGASLRATKTGDVPLIESIGEVMRMVEEVRDSALQLRMVPIGATFSRFQRVVRDVGAELGKEIQLLITGGDTEVDKSVVEKIGDPLMHLVRNSMDHGIEPNAVRAASGKSAKGTLQLNAYHESGNIVIEVKDDGGGLNKDRILAKAVEKGLIAPGTQLSDKEIFNLIFEAGFSTADKVSNLSGRGVGMDVVRRNVNSLRGSIDVESATGMGSTFRIRLPLTLAIIDGFLVKVGNSDFVIPLDRVIECVEMPANSENRDYMDLRGEVLPFIRLRQLFEVEGGASRRENVVVVEHAGNKTGLVVDRLLGEFQTVIKPMGTLFGHVRGIGGFTILGSGEVALILEISSLIQRYSQLEKSTHA